MTKKECRFEAVYYEKEDRVGIWDNEKQRLAGVLYSNYCRLAPLIVKQFNKKAQRIESLNQDPRGYASEYMTSW